MRHITNFFEKVLTDRNGFLIIILMALLVAIAFFSTPVFPQTFEVGGIVLNDGMKLYLDKFESKDCIYVVYGTADAPGSGERNTELAPLRAMAAAEYLRSRGLVSVASSIPLTRQIYRTAYVDAIPMPTPYDDSVVNQKIALLESENRNLWGEIKVFQDKFDLLGSMLDEEFLAIENKIKEAGAHKFGFVAEVSRLISRNPARQNYALGISYGLSPSLRIEGSVLVGGSYESQNSDLGAKFVGRYRVGVWEIGAGALYRAAGRRADPWGEDDKYLAFSPFARYYFGIPFIEVGYAYEIHLNWHNEVSLYSQNYNEHRISFGVGIVVE